MTVDKYPFEEYAPDQWWLHELRNTGEFTDDLKRAIGVAVNFSDTAFRKVSELQTEIERLKALVGETPNTIKVCECGPLRNITNGGHFAACTRCKRRI